MAEDIRKLSMDELDKVVGGMPASIPGSHYDPNLGMWVEDGKPGTVNKSGVISVGVAPR